MSGVEQIKATIGENEAFATLPEQAEPCGKVRARDDFVFDSGGHVAVRGLSFGKTADYKVMRQRAIRDATLPLLSWTFLLKKVRFLQPLLRRVICITFRHP